MLVIGQTGGEGDRKEAEAPPDEPPKRIGPG
jgi:hypothetical protein